ncbi:hypothetical protein M0805_007603 [Coniferiporia weirii]|nr:hypothetical protein M0805_007603 [Coniferiporia weirii]
MIIPINLPAHVPKSENKFPPQLAKLGSEEVVLIELQGSIEVEGSQWGQPIGRLKFDENDSKPTMLIGHNLLEGKIVNLPKPLAVLFKKDIDVSGAGEDSKGGATCEYDMVAVVKRKILFSKRPMPIVNMMSAPSDFGSKK